MRGIRSPHLKTRCTKRWSPLTTGVLSWGTLYKTWPGYYSLITFTRLYRSNIATLNQRDFLLVPVAITPASRTKKHPAQNQDGPEVDDTQFRRTLTVSRNKPFLEEGLLGRRAVAFPSSGAVERYLCLDYQPHVHSATATDRAGR